MLKIANGMYHVNSECLQPEFSPIDKTFEDVFRKPRKIHFYFTFWPQEGWSITCSNFKVPRVFTGQYLFHCGENRKKNRLIMFQSHYTVQ